MVKTIDFRSMLFQSQAEALPWVFFCFQLFITTPAPGKQKRQTYEQNRGEIITEYSFDF